MNTKPSFVLSLMVALGCAADETDAGSFEPQLTEAAAVWARDKPTCAPYHYTRTTSSFTGSRTETAVEITNDRPSRRRYVAHFVQDDGQVKTEQWDETGPAIGTHDGPFQAQTVEQLFAECREALARDPAANHLTLRIGAHGVPSTCAFFPMNCADDCSMGVSLSDFACGPLP